MKNKFLYIPLFIFAILNLYGYQKTYTPKEKTGTVKITFVNTVKGKPIQLNTSTYTNPFAEQYSISKFKYYISHVGLVFLGGTDIENESCYLIDESKPESLSLSFAAVEKTYSAVSFLLGVDSILNVSGAQTGALDPLNDMFWTWNSGYIMAKMEGHSPQSKVVNNKVEYHIGGFSGANNVLKNITLNFPAGKKLYISAGKTSEIFIEADFETWWQHADELKIAEHPVCTTPGTLAKLIANNYSNMFTIKNVINN